VKQQKPILHSRDHEHGGADPVRTVWEDVGGSAGTTTQQVLQSFSVPGARVVANGNARWYPPRPCSLTLAHAAVGTAPAGSGLTVRVKQNGVSIGTATIPAGSFTATFVPSVSSLAVGDYLTVDVTAVGSTTPGSDLVVQFVGAWA
jgi:hypothetical protein